MNKSLDAPIIPHVPQHSFKQVNGGRDDLVESGDCEHCEEWQKKRRSAEDGSRDTLYS
jgi:hypothetical protein